MSSISQDHSKRVMAFFVEEDVNGQTLAEIAAFVANLAHSRSWLIGPPALINEADDPRYLSSGETPPNDVGVYFEVYSELRPLSLDEETRRQQHEDIVALLTALERFAGEAKLDFDLEIDGDQVGGIKGGKLDEILVRDWIDRQHQA